MFENVFIIKVKWTFLTKASILMAKNLYLTMRNFLELQLHHRFKDERLTIVGKAMNWLKVATEKQQGILIMN